MKSSFFRPGSKVLLAAALTVLILGSLHSVYAVSIGDPCSEPINTCTCSDAYEKVVCSALEWRDCAALPPESPACANPQCASLSCEPNNPPTNISLNPTSIAENQPVGTAVGTFTTTDPDSGDTHTYSFVSGGADNGSFTIAGSTLKTGAAFDYETKSSYNILVKTDDGKGGTFQKSFTISVTNVNEAPTNISLTQNSLAENQPAGTAVGTFSTTDPDTGNTHTYSLVTGTGGDDNASFTISGSSLKTAAILDFETKTSCKILVQTNDGNGGTFQKAFTITVTNANDAPTDISLSQSSVTEKQPAGTAVGTFSTTDQDTANTHTYTLVTGTGSTDNTSFTIETGALKTAAVFDYAAKNSYSIRVKTDDGSGGTFEKQFTISVTEAANQAPTDITLSSTSVAEKQPAGTTVGTFTTTDADTEDTHTYSLVTGEGDTDNASFTIDSDALKTEAEFDYATKNSYSIRVKTDDGNGATFEKQFTISVTEGENQTPTNITLSKNTVDENQDAGTEVGSFTTTDPDTEDTHTYTLAAGEGDTDNASFAIEGNKLKTAEAFDFETKASYSIRVQTDDGRGGTFQKQFAIAVNDVAEGSDRVVTIKVNQSYTFKPADFADDTTNFAGIELVSVQTAGDLKYDGNAVAAGSQYADVTKLIFTPASNAYSNSYASFSFKIKSSSGSLSEARTMTIHVTIDPGDFNCSGETDLGDFIIALKLLAEIDTDDICNADADGDGKVGIKDVIYILNKLLETGS
jgi:hypothetical protein